MSNVGDFFGILADRETIKRAGEHVMNMNKDEFITYGFAGGQIDYEPSESLEANVIYQKVFGRIINVLGTNEIRPQKHGRMTGCMEYCINRRYEYEIL